MPFPGFLHLGRNSLQGLIPGYPDVYSFPPFAVGVPLQWIENPVRAVDVFVEGKASRAWPSLKAGSYEVLL